jgi:proteic killer suppression protein
VIRSILYKGLRRFLTQDDSRGLFPEHVPKVRDILARLDASRTITDMDLPGFRLHALKGRLAGFWGGYRPWELAGYFPV